MFMRLITLLRNKVKKVCDIHYEVGTIYNININLTEQAIALFLLNKKNYFFK